MEGGRGTAQLVAGILNAAYMVRYYARGGRTTIGRKKRTEAIRHLGVTVRDALNNSKDYEALLGAVVAGLKPNDYDPPF